MSTFLNEYDVTYMQGINHQNTKMNTEIDAEYS